MTDVTKKSSLCFTICTLLGVDTVYFSTDFDDFFVIMFLPVLFQYQFINLFIESCTCTELMAKRVKRYNIQHYNIHRMKTMRNMYVSTPNNVQIVKQSDDEFSKSITTSIFRQGSLC
jgi:hypothetical protein